WRRESRAGDVPCDHARVAAQVARVPRRRQRVPAGGRLPDRDERQRGVHTRSEERRVGKSVDLGGRRIIKKKKKKNEITNADLSKLINKQNIYYRITILQ